MGQWTKCARCTQVIETGSTHCSHCGARQVGATARAPELMICSQCLTTATPQRIRQAGPVGCGLLLVLVSLFFFWPLLIVGLVVMLLGSVLGAKTFKKCPECKSQTLVPLHTPAGIELTARAQAIHQQRLIGQQSWQPGPPADMAGRPWKPPS